MRKVLLSLSMIALVGTAGLAQNAQKSNLSAEKMVYGKHLTTPTFAESSSVSTSRAEGDIIWGDEPGQGDFSVAANWEILSSSNPPHGWEISTNPNDPPNFQQTASLVPVAFPGATNGYALCDSDAAGEGSTTNTTIHWNGDPIDCSTYDFVSLRFKTATRNFASTYYVVVSNDGGATWNDVEVLQEITTNVNTTNPQIVEVNISEFAGNESDVMIGFRYEAEWGWFWAIDDVELFETWNYDLSMVNSITSMGALGYKYTIVPVDQVLSNSRVGFGADVKNNGASPITGTLEVTQGAWTGNSASTTMTPSATETDSLFIAIADGFPVPATVGTYNFSLGLDIAETVQNPDLTERTMPFSVSPLIYAGDDYDGTPASLNGGFFGWATAEGDPGIGREFEINTNGSIGRVSVAIANVNTENQNTYIGNELFVELWVGDGENYDFLDISEAHEVVASNFGNIVHCYFNNPVEVNAGEVILAIASSTVNGLVPVAWSGQHADGNTVGKAGANLVTLASDGPYVDAPVIRLDFGDYTSIEGNVFVNEDVVIYPNPAADNATVSFTLTEEAAVSIVVRDLSGKVVYTIDYASMVAGQQYNETIDLSGLAQGMYTVTLSANGAQTTQKLIKK
jgi:hypothetical protein